MRVNRLAVVLAATLPLGCGGGGGGSGGGGAGDATLANLAVSAGTLTPAFDPAITAYVDAVGNSAASIRLTPTTNQAGATVTVAGVPTPSGSESAPVPLGVGPTPIDVAVTSPNGTTVVHTTVTVTRGTPASVAQEAYVKASNTASGDAFAFQNAIALYGNTLVVGAAGEASGAVGVNGNQADDSAPSAGAVYVFVRSGSTWTQQAYLKASNTEMGDAFGTAVAIWGDTIVVTAQGESSAATGVNGNQADNSAPVSGAAYVFVRSGSTWTQQAYLKASNAAANDGLFSAAIHGDTIALGANSEDSGATGVGGNQADDSAPQAGAVYVFVRSGTTWSQQAYVKSSNASAGDAFGANIALSGDTLVVGASGEDSNAIGVDGNQADDSLADAGAAYVFRRVGTTWSQEAYLKASNSGAGDFFGAVAISGDTVVVGAPGEDGNGTSQFDESAPDSGAAYVFARSGAAWSQQAYLKASNAASGDRLGFRLAIDADTLVVGARLEDSGATGLNGNQADDSAPDAGAAYVFTRAALAWSQPFYVKASNAEASDNFGLSVAVSGDTFALGAPFESSNATGIDGNQGDDSLTFAGAAYVFR
jgi:hypothetical protein